VAFVLASTGHTKQFDVELYPLHSGDSRSVLVDAASCREHGMDVFDCGESDDRRTRMRDEFGWIFRMGLEKPVFVPIPLHGEQPGRPSLLLGLCKMERSQEGKMPCHRELTTLGNRIGQMVDSFCESRSEILEHWLQKTLGDPNQSVDANFAKISELARQIFQVDDCIIWARTPRRAKSDKDLGWRYASDIPQLAEVPRKNCQHFLQELSRVDQSRGVRLNEVAVEGTINARLLEELIEESRDLDPQKKHSRQGQTGETRCLRTMIYRWRRPAASEAEMIFVVYRSATQRPFTRFNLELLGRLAELCRPTLEDWQRNSEGALPSARPFPIANGPAARVHSYLRRLTDRLGDANVRKPSARVLFQCEAQPPTFYIGASTENEKDRYFSGDVQRLCTAVLCTSVIPSSEEARFYYSVGFETWIGHQLARGVIEIEFKSEPSKEQTATLEEGLTNAQRQIPAFYAADNDRRACEQILASSPADLSTHLSRYFLSCCREGGDGFRRVERPQAIVCDAILPEEQQKLLPPQYLKYWADADLRSFGVRFIHEGRQRPIMLFSVDRLSDIVVECPELPSIPCAAGAVDSAPWLDYRRKIGSYRQGLRAFVGKIASQNYFLNYLQAQGCLPEAAEAEKKKARTVNRKNAYLKTKDE
jgi:hypothetical protein